MTVYYQIEGSLSPGSQWFQPRGVAGNGRYETRAEAIAAVPQFRVRGIGIRVRRVDTEKEALRNVPKRAIIVSPVSCGPSILRKRGTQ